MNRFKTQIYPLNYFKHILDYSLSIKLFFGHELIQIIQIYYFDINLLHLNQVSKYDSLNMDSFKNPNYLLDIKLFKEYKSSLVYRIIFDMIS